MTAERFASAAFVVSALASIGLVVVYLTGGDAQLEGVLLGLGLGGLGTGVIAWTTLLPGEAESEDRVALSTDDQGPRDRAQSEVEKRPIETGPVTRRSLLVRLVTGAAGALGAALAIPALSLGPRPGQSLFRTTWTAGARVVDEGGTPIRPGDIGPDSVMTVFPEGEVGSPDAQAVVVRVDPAELTLANGRAEWAPEGAIAYSKICTHAGCPVGLYRAESHELLCPCHQSTFDVLTGADPTSGPADRPLPQLPMEVDEEGFLVARGDFTEPVGPGFWNMTGGES